MLHVLPDVPLDESVHMVDGTKLPKFCLAEVNIAANCVVPNRYRVAQRERVRHARWCTGELLCPQIVPYLRQKSHTKPKKEINP